MGCQSVGPACAAPRREKTYDRRQRLKSVVPSNTPPTISAPGIPEPITRAGAARHVAVAQALETGLDNAAVAPLMHTQTATAKDLIAASPEGPGSEQSVHACKYNHDNCIRLARCRRGTQKVMPFAVVQDDRAWSGL